MKQPNSSIRTSGFAVIEAIIILIVVAGIGFAGFTVVQRNHKKAQPVSSQTVKTATTTVAATAPAPKPAELITAMPLDLSQVASISAFRSCAGHDYSGNNVSGQAETMRSMKHYIMPLDSLVGSVNIIKVYAPFDGQVASIIAEQTPVGKQVWLTPASGPAWIFKFFHTTPVVAQGQSFKAGDLIGYENLSRTTVSSFDIALARFADASGNVASLAQLNKMMAAYGSGSSTGYGNDGGKPQDSMTQQYDSIFNHMNPDILAQFAKKGITPANIVISKAQRDANPCVLSNGHFVSSAADSVTLTQ